MLIWLVEGAWLSLLGWLSIACTFWFGKAYLVAGCLLILIVIRRLPLGLTWQCILELRVISQSLQLWIILRPGLWVRVWLSPLGLALRGGGVGSSCASGASSKRLLALAQAWIASNLSTLRDWWPVRWDSYRASLLHALGLLYLWLKAHRWKVPQKLFRVQKVAFAQLLSNWTGLVVLLASLVC